MSSLSDILQTDVQTGLPPPPPPPTLNSQHVHQSSSEGVQQRQSQMAATLEWLQENYERSDGVCLPRCVLYSHYLDFCKRFGFKTPAGAATFGKILRQRFPKITTRRLGTRGQSKYHYYGIGIKEDSIYYRTVYAGRGLTRFSGMKLKSESSSRKYSLSSKTGTLLPEFPSANSLILPPNVPPSKMNTFLMMYRTHCQRILDTVVGSNFLEVENFLLHFWHGMPEHLVEVLESDLLPNLIAVCDSILYRVLLDVLIPNSIHDFPDSLCHDIEQFASRLPIWMSQALETATDDIRTLKLQACKDFVDNLSQQLNFIKVASVARIAMSEEESTGRVVKELEQVDISDVCQQMAAEACEYMKTNMTSVTEGWQTVLDLLTQSSPVEALIEWLDGLFDRLVMQKSKNGKTSFDTTGPEFALYWSRFCSLLSKELTLNGCSKMATIHLLCVVLDEYISLIVSSHKQSEKEKLVHQNMEVHLQPTDGVNSNKTAPCVTKKRRKLESDVIEQDCKGIFAPYETANIRPVSSTSPAAIAGFGQDAPPSALSTLTPSLPPAPLSTGLSNTSFASGFPSGFVAPSLPVTLAGSLPGSFNAPASLPGALPIQSQQSSHLGAFSRFDATLGKSSPDSTCANNPGPPMATWPTAPVSSAAPYLPGAGGVPSYYSDLTPAPLQPSIPLQPLGALPAGSYWEGQGSYTANPAYAPTYNQRAVEHYSKGLQPTSYLVGSAYEALGRYDSARPLYGRDVLQPAMQTFTGDGSGFGGYAGPACPPIDPTQIQADDPYRAARHYINASFR